MTTTLITDDFAEDPSEEYDVVTNTYRKEHNKQMTDVAKVLYQARLVYKIKGK